MKNLLVFIVFLFGFGNAIAQDMETPSERVQVAVADILAIAQNKDISADERKAGLEEALKKHVDLQAASQRVIAKYWRKASKEEKLEFMRLFRLVLTNTYANLLETYNNEEVRIEKEEIKKKKYASVDTIVISGGKEIPVTYQLLNRGDEWKIYDFVAEGISLVRSYSTDYQSILRKDGVTGLNQQLAEKFEAQVSE